MLPITKYRELRLPPLLNQIAKYLNKQIVIKMHQNNATNATKRGMNVGYEIMKPIEGGHGGCLHCGYQHSILPMDAVIAVGFGYAAVTKDGKEVYNENEVCRDNWDNAWTVQTAEDEAAKDPEHDWRIHLIAPLSERHYQRQGENHWVLYEKGMGFA